VRLCQIKTSKNKNIANSRELTTSQENAKYETNTFVKSIISVHFLFCEKSYLIQKKNGFVFFAKVCEFKKSSVLEVESMNAEYQLDEHCSLVLWYLLFSLLLIEVEKKLKCSVYFPCLDKVLENIFGFKFVSLNC